MKNKPAGWYRNLDDRRQHGYWDGDAWVDPHDTDRSAEPPDDGSEDHHDAGVDADDDPG